MTSEPSGRLYTVVTKYWPRLAGGLVVVIGLGDRAVGSLTADSGLERYVVIWAALSAGLWFLFEKAEGTLSDETREIVVRQLQKDTVGRAIQSLPAQFSALFDRVFGEKHLTVRCATASLIASILTVAAFSIGLPAPTEWQVDQAMLQGVAFIALLLLGGVFFGEVVQLVRRLLVRVPTKVRLVVTYSSAAAAWIGIVARSEPGPLWGIAGLLTGLAITATFPRFDTSMKTAMSRTPDGKRRWLTLAFILVGNVVGAVAIGEMVSGGMLTEIGTFSGRLWGDFEPGLNLTAWFGVIALSSLFNFIPDYVSLLQTRWAIGWMQAGRRGWVLILDFLLTAAISLASLWAFFAYSSWMGLPPRNIDIRNPVSVLVGIVSGQGGVIGWERVYFFSAFFTSVWLWLYAASILLSRVLLRMNSGVGFLLRVTDVEKQPFRSMGFVSVLIVSGLFALGLPLVLL